MSFNQTYEQALAKRQARDARRTERAPMLRCQRPMKTRSRMKARSHPEAGAIRDLENTLDDLTRKVLRQDERVSFTSGRRGTANDPLEVSHLFGRALRPTRFDCHPDGNCHMQTRSENQAHNSDKSIYRDKYIERFGEEAYRDLDRRAHQGEKWTYIELAKMILQRESMLR
jgi:hypothetical protein